MARFVMANRRAGLFHETAKRAARESIDRTVVAVELSKWATIIGPGVQPGPERRRVVVFEADPAEVKMKTATLPSPVMLEPEILHYPATALPLDVAGIEARVNGTPIPAGGGQSMQVVVRGSGTALECAEVTLYLRARWGDFTKMEAKTPADGRVSFEFSHVWEPAVVVAQPLGGFWSVAVRAPRGHVDVDLPALPAGGSPPWWHERLGLVGYDADRGQGIRVGVIDTGAGPHPALNHVQSAGAFVGGQYDPRGGQDARSHGTHVCGILGARPAVSDQFAGITPGVSLFSARVFESQGSANQGDIANAMDYLSADLRVDLVNMSLGSSTPSEIERDAIVDALERGTLCVCAAGNSNGPVQYPAAFSEAVAVAALGLHGWAPATTIDANRYADTPDRHGEEGLYLANFSCFGDEIDVAAPGVGIISTVPERCGVHAPFAAMMGTSMASPVACAALAGILSSSPEYLALPRDLTRARTARYLLARACRTVGLAPRYQGSGMPALR